MKYQDVIHYIEEEINAGHLTAGSKLPSVRILAHELSCSKSTVAKAYDKLVEHKLAYVIDKTGFFLMNNPESRLISKQMDFALSNAYRLIDKRDMVHMINHGLEEADLHESDIEGYHPLRVSLKSYFKKRKIFTSIHDIVMLPSIEQAIMSIASMSRFDKIIIENPTDKSLVTQLNRKKNLFTFNRLTIDWDLLELQLKKEDIKLLIITTHMHIPTSKSLDLGEKQRLLNMCQSNGVYILEINHFEDLFDYDESQSLYALDKYEIVIHLKSFNHVFANIISDVALVCPKSISEHLKLFKNKYVGQNTLFNQLILNEILKEYDIKQNIKYFSSKFDIIKKYLGNLPFQVNYADTENFAFIELPFHYNLETVLVELEQKNIYLESIKSYFLNQHDSKGFIIAVNEINSKDLHKIMQVILESFAH